ncbi:MAG: peptidoglycan-binding domain-containing protein, partial [Patescibacteria group bacterium]|nr:peptidoglycan-binding domain-containing protein [Patescibacteria group bacterium]
MKKYSIIFGLVFLGVGLVAQAATTDFTANGDVTVDSVAGSGVTADLTISSGSRAETVVTSGQLQVTNPDANSRFTVTTSDTSVASLRVTLGGNEVVCETSSVTLPSGSGTYAITPSSTACSSGNPGNSSGPSGSTGTPRGDDDVDDDDDDVDDDDDDVDDDDDDDDNNADDTGEPDTPIGQPVSPTFTRVLYLNVVHPEVGDAQRLLNRDPDTKVALTGPGSPGNETNYFGALTQAAVKRFQIKYHIADHSTVGFGIIG